MTRGNQDYVYKREPHEVSAKRAAGVADDLYTKARRMYWAQPPAGSDEDKDKPKSDKDK